MGVMENRIRVVFFDGRCPFCVGWVRFLLDRDGRDCLRFASLQSAWSRGFFERNGLKPPELDTLLVWDGQVLHAQSEAVVSIAEVLPGAWRMGRHLEKLPAGVRNRVYAFIAERRHDWFGQKPACWIPREEYRRKFLDLSDPVYKGS